MTKSEDPPAAPARANKGGRKLQPGNVSRVRETGRLAGKRGGMFTPIVDPAGRAAARAIYEATPGMTLAALSKELGVTVKVLAEWKGADDWKACARSIPNLSGRAGQLANQFKVSMSELGKPLSDEVAAAEVSKELAVQHAVDIRAAVLDRHRKEWSAPRKLAYDAISLSSKGDIAGGFERAKMAKITAETLQIIQVGECRAFGLNHDSRGQDGGTVVLIERETSPLIEHGALPDMGRSGEVSDDGEVF